MRTIMLSLAVLLLLAAPALGSVVDATEAESLYQSGDYQAAHSAFAELTAEFRQAATDSNDYRTYREAIYLYDRLADCAFTQRDWANLKRYLDGVYALSLSEQNLTKEQLAGALASGVAFATANYLSARLDECVRMATLLQVKRTIVLVLYVTDGEGAAGEEAIRLYQLMVASMLNVVEIADGGYSLNLPVLEQNLAEFEEIISGLETLGSDPAVGDLDELWKQYQPIAYSDNAE